MSVSRVWRLLYPLLIYVGLAVLLTWPLAQQFATHVPGDGIDDPSLAWNLWWVKERLIDQRNLDIFHVDWSFYPIGINLAFYTLTPLNGLLSIPIQTGLSLVVANNLLLLSSFVFGGFGIYLLASQELRNSQSTIHNSQLAALFAGTVYAFASSKLFYAGLGQFNIASSQWIPFCALYVLRLARCTNWHEGLRNALLAALFLTLQAWAELTYASFLIILIGLVFCWSLWVGRRTTNDEQPTMNDHAVDVKRHRGPSTDKWGLHRLKDHQSITVTRNTQHATRFLSFTLLTIVFLIGIAPFLWAMIPDMVAEGDFFASGGGFADNYSADLLGYLLPTQRHPLLGGLVDHFSFPHKEGQQIFIGYSALLLSILGAVTWLRRKSARSWGLLWIVVTFFFWWMTLGAQLRWHGQPLPIPGPFALISQLPFFSGNRYPSRYSVMLMMGIAVLAGAGLLYLLSRVSQSRASAARLSLSRVSLSLVFSALFLFEHLAIPMPLSDFRVPAIYERLATESGDFTLLELPTGWRNGARVMGKSDILIMMQQWYQTVHGKRRLGGNTSRNPPYKFQYFTEAPLLGDLIALMNATTDDDAQNEIARVAEEEFDTIVARNRAIAGDVLDFLDVAYVTVHVEKASPALLRFVDEVLPLTLVESWDGPDWRGAPSTIRLYRVEPLQRPSSWTIDLADPTSTLYLAEGWSLLPWQGMRYTTRSCATLLLDLPERAGTLSLALAAPAIDVTATVNGQAVNLTTTTEREATMMVALPAGVATEPVDRVTLCTTHSTPVNAITAPPTDRGWPIGETAVAVPVSIIAQSAGNDVGNFARVLRNGEAVMAAQTGYNLAAFDATGTLLNAATFNTFASAAEADALADWLQRWPADTVIAGAVMDEASLSLTPRTVDALRTIGVTTDLRNRFRWSHAFVGVVGAAPGTAVEEANLLQPASVAIGVAIDAPIVYLGVGQIHYEVKN